MLKFWQVINTVGTGGTDSMPNSGTTSDVNMYKSNEMIRNFYRYRYLRSFDIEMKHYILLRYYTSVIESK
jgi:hypothetical protein